MKEKLYRWLFPIIAMVGMLWWWWSRKQHAAAQSTAVALHEIDKLKEHDAQVARAHRKEGDGHKALGEAATAHMKMLEKEAKELGHDKLASYIKNWY